MAGNVNLIDVLPCTRSGIGSVSVPGKEFVHNATTLYRSKLRKNTRTLFRLLQICRFLQNRPDGRTWQREDLVEEIFEIAEGRYKYKEPPEIKGTGYVVKSLEAALWAFCHSTSFKDGCLLAANLGDDAHTTGAVYGQLAGAFYGVDNIPGHWLEKISHRKLIEHLAEKLFDLSGRIQRRHP